MTTPPFVTTLRARAATIQVDGGDGGGEPITVRVQMPEVWDTVRIEAPPETPVIAVKARAIAALCPEVTFPDDLVVKLNGFEVLDEHMSLAEAGAGDGSTFLLTYRRRRPVR